MTNTAAVSFLDITAELSDALGRQITYQSPSVKEFQSVLKQRGLPDTYIGMFIMWAMAVAQGTMDVQDHTLEIFLGRTPITAQQFIHQLYA